MTIEVHYEFEAPELPPEEARRVLAAAFAHAGREPEGVELVFVDDARLAALHAEYLDDPTPTDVMAFDLTDEFGGPQAEVYVSVERARAVAAARGLPVRRELALYVAHGALHLCGHDDHAEPARALMRSAEREVLRGLGYPDESASE